MLFMFCVVLLFKPRWLNSGFIWVVRRKTNKQTYRPVLMILKLLSKGRFRDWTYFNLCMHCLFGISGLKMHTVARAWIAVLEEWNWSFLQKLCVTILWWLFIVEPRVGTSIDYGGLRFPLSTNVIWNIRIHSKVF